MSKFIIPPVFVAIAVILIVVFYFVFPEFNYIPFPINILGLFFSFVGFSIMGKSRDLFKKYKTTLAIEKSSFFIQEGIFLKTRNPMYIGMVLRLLGLGICFRNIFSIMLPLIFFIITHCVFVRKEEKLMSETFGEAYRDYKNKVKRWI